MNRECIINLLDLPLSTGTVTYIMKDLCNVYSSKVAIKVENKKSYSNAVEYHVTDDLCDWLSEFFESECPKNGAQIYKDLDTDEYYLCLTDSNYYDKETDEYKGTDEIHIYFKQFSWDNLQAK